MGLDLAVAAVETSAAQCRAFNSCRNTGVSEANDLEAGPSRNRPLTCANWWAILGLNQ